MKQISLSGKNGKGKFYLVDDEDFKKISYFKWYLTSNGYVARKTKHIQDYLHRYIMNCPKGMFIDHIDFNRLNCQKSNLRICTKAQNNFHQYTRKLGKTGFRGITKSPNGKKWYSNISYGDKHIHIGSYATLTEAIKARRGKEKELFGEFSL